MSLVRFALSAMLLGIGFSSGCCTIGGYGGGCGGGCASAPSCGSSSPGCGLPGHSLGASCGAETYYCGGCSDGGCAGCGDGPVIPCGPNTTPSSCLGLGLGCIGKLVGLDACGGCGGGCGETYYHEWINDPPCCDPCDGCGNWTGEAGAGSLGSCNAGCGGGCGGGCDVGPGCGLASPGYVEPSCGCAGVGCGMGGGHVGKSLFQLPGRALFATWAGVGGLARELRRGLLPSCGSCNAFSISGNCNKLLVWAQLRRSSFVQYVFRRCRRRLCWGRLWRRLFDLQSPGGGWPSASWRLSGPPTTRSTNGDPWFWSSVGSAAG